METPAALALYRPRANQESRLAELIVTHVPLLRRLGLLSDGAAVLMRTEPGTYIEVLRWRSPEAARRAGADPEVRQLWHEISAVSDSPAIDATRDSPSEGPRFLPVTLLKRPSETDPATPPRLGVLAYVIGALSLLPLVGLPLAAISVLWGLLTKRRGGRSLAWLGIGGIAISTLTIAAVIAFRVNSPFGPAQAAMTRSSLTSAVLAIEFHKVQTGHYPGGLRDLRDSVPRESMMVFLDFPPQTWSQIFDLRPRWFFYERIDDDHYYLLSVGPDDLPFTADDTVPPIDIKPGSRVGLMIKREDQG